MKQELSEDNAARRKGMIRYEKSLEVIIVKDKRQNDCLWKQRTHYGLENGSPGFIATFHKQ